MKALFENDLRTFQLYEFGEQWRDGIAGRENNREKDMQVQNPWQRQEWSTSTLHWVEQGIGVTRVEPRNSIRNWLFRPDFTMEAVRCF